MAWCLVKHGDNYTFFTMYKYIVLQIKRIAGNMVNKLLGTVEKGWSSRTLTENLARSKQQKAEYNINVDFTEIE